MRHLQHVRRRVVPQLSARVRRAEEHGTRMVRFGLVGTSGVLVNTAILYLLTEVGGLHHLVAAILATETAILSNFLLNDCWTFRDAKPSTSCMRRMLWYNSIALGGLAISVAVLAALTFLLHIYYLEANLVAIGTATLWNYAANRLWTWPGMYLAPPTSDLAGTHD